MHYLFFVLLCVIWSSSFILMKKAAVSFGPLTISGLRCLLAAVAIGTLWRLLGQQRPPRRQDVLALLAVAATGYAIPYALQPFLVARYGSGFIGMMIVFVPLLTIGLSIPILRVYPTRLQLVGVLGGLGCMGVVLADGLERHVPLGHLMLALVVPVCYAFANVVVKRAFSHVTPVALTLLGTSLAALVLVPAGLALEPVRVAEGFGLSTASLIILGVLGTGLAVYLFYRLIQDQGPLFAGMVTYLIPVGAVLLGWLDQERVTALQLLALAGVLGMVGLVQVDVVRQNRRAATD